ncbi:hypothetical protein N7486_006451 [Penicillium sp. IBT 16267x]|nr:hypothetical protein N7486_006451 [Penicillium sp. IBT 16267x]
MADCPFARCPTEIVHTILSYLDHTSPLSVRALAYTSKDFLLVSSSFIYHTVKIQLDREDHDTISTQTNQLYKELEWVNAFSQVRCLIIEPPRYDGKQNPLPSTPIKRDIRALRHYVLETPSVPHRATFQYPTPTQEGDSMWLPIANLLRQLPSLNDLLYGGRHQFAPCLLKAIHEDSSSCRLWLNRFKLHSLGAEQIDSHELALLASPHLYSIRLDGSALGEKASRDRSLDQENVYDEEILCRTVAGLSPHLKEIHARYCGDPAYFPTEEPREQQNCFDSQITRGSLHYLSIRGDENKSVNKETLTMWNDCTDFSVLRTLRITSPLRYQALEFLANDCSFTSLRSLELNLSLFATRLAWRLGQFDTPETRFLCSLPPLFTLTLHNWTNKYPLECFLPHHGSQLTKLVISTGKNAHLSPSDLKSISEYCPNLQELEITVRRTQGDATEVECYRNLGDLPQLRNLAIKLDVTSIKLCNSNYGGTEAPAGSKCVITAPDASFEEFDMKPCVRRTKFTPRGCLYRNGDIREILINHAIDENLAKAIFKTIQSNKKPGTEPLQSLDISCIGTVGLKKHHTRSIWPFPHQAVLSALERPWHVTHLSKGELKVEEMRSSMKVETSGLGNRPLAAWLERPFRRIWPQQQEGSSWMADWHSLPLCMA